ncbi:MAG: hypothetical protein IT305_01570 [Chloroflexi bacterium]|nr:hypothetical protein [Chloroflexota bacterium]
MPSDWLTALVDPTAPLPAGWPGGALGAFLLFLIPIGGGIPLGVLMARDAGVSPPVMALMYLVSDIFMAVTHEPFFWLLGWLASLIPVLGKIRDFLRKSTNRAGLQGEGGRGPLGLILFSFTVDPISGRGAAAAAGHGFVTGWTFAILGDMLYFGVLMVATIWLSGIFGDERVTVGGVLVLVWGLSWLLRRRQTRRAATAPALRPALAAASTLASGRELRAALSMPSNRLMRADSSSTAAMPEGAAYAAGPVMARTAPAAAPPEVTSVNDLPSRLGRTPPAGQALPQQKKRGKKPRRR